ncbi:MAG: hypothetical protein JWP85_2112 [Rhodoglobus sp.]|nr:hypothetical protein [Rhodoglobus sp.]
MKRLWQWPLQALAFVGLVLTWPVWVAALIWYVGFRKRDVTL